MERFEPKTIQARIYADPELRRIEYECRQAMNVWREREAEAEAQRLQEKPGRLKAFWERLGYTPDRASDEREIARRRLLAMPPAEAWMFEHPDSFDAETAPTLSAVRSLVRRERQRLKATRRILKELGVK